MIIFLDKVLDFLDYDGLHPQRKQGHARSVPGELRLIYWDERPFSRFGFCVQLVVNHSKNLMLTLISFFGFVNETDGWATCIRTKYSALIDVMIVYFRTFSSLLCIKRGWPRCWNVVFSVLVFFYNNLS